MFKGVYTVAIYVTDMARAKKFYTDVLGLKITDIENVAEQKVNVAFLPITDSEVELLQSTHEDGPVAKFIDAKGEGIQHIAYRVENIEEALAELETARDRVAAAAGEVHVHLPRHRQARVGGDRRAHSSERPPCERAARDDAIGPGSAGDPAGHADARPRRPRW